MQQMTGKHIIKCYDKYGHKVREIERSNYTLSFDAAECWENENEGNSAIIIRVLYNTVCNKDKWSYHTKM